MAFKTSYALLSLIAFISFNANSATITYNLTGNVLSGPFSGEVGTGTFSYDDTLISGTGTEFLNANSSLTIDFTIFGQIFTETDDVAFVNFGTPDLTLVDGAPVFLDFLVSETPGEEGATAVLTPIDQIGVFNFGFDFNGNNLVPIAGGFEATVIVNETAVPVPSAVWLFGSGLIGLIGVARRKKLNNFS